MLKLKESKKSEKESKKIVDYNNFNSPVISSKASSSSGPKPKTVIVDSGNWVLPASVTYSLCPSKVPIFEKVLKTWHFQDYFCISLILPLTHFFLICILISTYCSMTTLSCNLAFSHLQISSYNHYLFHLNHNNKKINFKKKIIDFNYPNY